MKKEQTDFEKLQGKLRLPIHISYIAKYILGKTEEQTKEVLKKGVEEGTLEESKQNGYYSLKNSRK